MKEKLIKYKAEFMGVPEPLQKQIFLRLGFALAFLLLFFLLLGISFDWMAVIPFLVLSVYSVVGVCLLFRRAASGGYVVIRGCCVKSVSTLIRKRTKSVLVDTEEHSVRLVLRQRLKRIPKGTELEVYIADNTPVYEKDGAKLLQSYLAIHINRGGEGYETTKSERSVSEAKGH